MSLRLIPAPCAVLGIDPGASSGRALLYRDARTGRATLDESGVCKKPIERRDAVRRAVARAAELRLPLALCIEAHTHHGMTPATYAGLRSSAAVWMEHASLEAPGAPIIEPMPNRWRAALGLRANGGGPDAWKRAAVLGVRGRYGVSATHDEAEAVCLATFALFSDDLLAELAAAQRRAARAPHVPGVVVDEVSRALAWKLARRAGIPVPEKR
jgi:hypothetical protein